MRFGYEWDEVGNLVRARRWDLTTAEKTSYGSASSVGAAHPTRTADAEMKYQYDGGSRVVKSSTRTTGTKYTVYPFSTLELRSVDLTGTGTAQDYALGTETTQIRLGAGSISGRVLYNATMPRTGASNLHLFLEFGDHLGSTTFTIDHDTSEVVEYITYTAYGQTESDYRMSRWSNFRESFRFTGKEEDIEVGLNYHGARYYSPALKRWLSADPVTTHEAGSDINPYGYGGSNPTANVDPDGREFITIIAVVVISAFVAGATSATVQYATTGHVDWGWKGVAGAAFAGAIGGAVGMGVGALASGLGPLAAGSIGGAAGGASSGMAGTALAGGSASDIGKSALIGAVSGAVGGAVGVAAGSTSSSGWTAAGGTMAGTGAGTAAGIGAGWAIFGQDPTWQSVGIAFASAFGGALASTALSKGYQAATERNTAGYASRDEAAAAGMREYQPKVAQMQADGDPHEIGFLVYRRGGSYGYSASVVGRAEVQGVGQQGYKLTLADFQSIELPDGATATDLAHIHPMTGRDAATGQSFPYPLGDGTTVMEPMSADDQNILKVPEWRKALGLTDDSRVYVGTPDRRMGVYSVSGSGISSDFPKLVKPGLDMPVQRTFFKKDNYLGKETSYTSF